LADIIHRSDLCRRQFPRGLFIRMSNIQQLPNGIFIYRKVGTGDRIRQLGGDRLVNDIARADARRYPNKLKNGNYAPASANKLLHFVSALFNVALREQELDKANPWKALRVPDREPDKDKRHPFSMEQATVVFWSATI